jgi:uncharacterized membrane protein
MALFNKRACDLSHPKDRPDTPSDARSRSLSKAISWRVVGTLDTFLIGTVITQQVSVGAAIASIELVTKVVLYYIHERVWNKL